MLGVAFLSVISVMAASSIANIVKSSLGPVGLDKMLVDDIGVSLVDRIPPSFFIYITIYEVFIN